MRLNPEAKKEILLLVEAVAGVGILIIMFLLLLFIFAGFEK